MFVVLRKFFPGESLPQFAENFVPEILEPLVLAPRSLLFVDLMVIVKISQQECQNLSMVHS